MEGTVRKFAVTKFAVSEFAVSEFAVSEFAVSEGRAFYMMAVCSLRGVHFVISKAGANISVDAVFLPAKVLSIC